MQASRPRERRQPVILALGVIGLALLFSERANAFFRS